MIFSAYDLNLFSMCLHAWKFSNSVQVFASGYTSMHVPTVVCEYARMHVLTVMCQCASMHVLTEVCQGASMDVLTVMCVCKHACSYCGICVCKYACFYYVSLWWWWLIPSDTISNALNVNCPTCDVLSMERKCLSKTSPSLLPLFLFPMTISGVQPTLSGCRTFFTTKCLCLVPFNPTHISSTQLGGTINWWYLQQ